MSAMTSVLDSVSRDFDVTFRDDFIAFLSAIEQGVTIRTPLPCWPGVVDDAQRALSKAARDRSPDREELDDISRLLSASELKTLNDQLEDRIRHATAQLSDHIRRREWQSR